MTTQEKLQRIHGYATRYELAVCNLKRPLGHQNILVSYIVRTSRQGMLDACRKYGPQLVDVCQVSGDQVMIFKRIPGHGYNIELGDWTIRLTGRTQRTAIIESELPFIMDEWNAIGKDVEVFHLNPTDADHDQADAETEAHNDDKVDDYLASREENDVR